MLKQLSSLSLYGLILFVQTTQPVPSAQMSKSPLWSLLTTSLSPLSACKTHSKQTNHEKTPYMQSTQNGFDNSDIYLNARQIAMNLVVFTPQYVYNVLARSVKGKSIWKLFQPVSSTYKLSCK